MPRTTVDLIDCQSLKFTEKVYCQKGFGTPLRNLIDNELRLDVAVAAFSLTFLVVVSVDAASRNR